MSTTTQSSTCFLCNIHYQSFQNYITTVIYFLLFHLPKRKTTNAFKMNFNYFSLCLLFTGFLTPTVETRQYDSPGDLIFYPRSEQSNIDIRNVEYDGSHNLYVGTANEIMQLNVSTLKPLNSFKTGPRYDNPNCLPYEEQNCAKQNSVLTDNANLLLMLDDANQQLIACGNVDQGSCFSLRSKNISNLIKQSDQLKLENIVRSSPDKSCKAVSYPNDKGSHLFVVACDSPDLSSTSTEKVREFLFSVRDLSPTDKLMRMHYMSSDFERFSFYKPTEMETKRIKIVATFTVGAFVYIIQTGDIKLEASSDIDSTRIGRFSIQDSELLLTYSEIPLTCKDSSGTEYTVASAVTVLRDPPAGLRSQLGITSMSGRSEVLLAVFRKSAGLGASTTGFQSSIVCGFSIENIDQTFKRVIKDCFNGIGKQGLGRDLLHDCQKYWEDDLTDEKILVRPYEDAYTSKLVMLSSYPDAVMGEIPDDLVTGTEIMVYKDELLTGVAATTVDEFTIVLVTTGQGKLKKISIKQSSEAPREYYEEVIFSGLSTAINSDIVLNADDNFVIFFTQSQLVKMPVHNCDAMTSCHQCVSSGGPYCGWCTLQDKCTHKTGCDGVTRGDANAWIRYEEQCIAIKEVTPQMVSIHYTEPTDHRPIRLTVTRLPQASSVDGGGLGFPLIYFCDFGGGTREGEQDQTRFILETESSERGSCGVPTASNFLQKVPKGQAFITVTLSIITELSSGKKLNLTSKQVKFYDCAALANCIECTSSRFECDWCLSSGRCVNSQLAGDVSALTDSCLIDQRIIGEHSSTAAEAGLKRGQDFCPQVGYPTFVREVKSFHVGAVNTAFELVFKNIPDVIYQTESENSLMCLVKQRPSSTETLPDTGTAVQSQGGFVQKMVAYPLDGFPNRVTCSAKNGLVIKGQESSVNASVTLQWGPNGLIADNPQQFTIEIYNCSRLASSCGECLSYVDKKFNCGYCQSSPSGFCTIESQCDNTFMTNNPDNICLNPRIISFHPRSGPLTGNTLINITGENLGRSVDNIARVYIQTPDAQIRCVLDYDLYLSAKTVVCKTSETSQDTEGSLVIEMNMSGSLPILVTSDVKFRYRSPEITDFSPKVGPLDGGTNLIVNGSNLDAGFSVSVYVAGYKCEVVERWAKWLMCVTGAAKHVGDRSSVRINVDTLYDQQSLANFQYKPNPTISKVEPAATIETGGTSVNVTGTDLDVVMFPKLRLIFSNVDTSSSAFAGATGPCTVMTSVLMTCEMPEVSRSFYQYQSSGYKLFKRDVRDGFLFASRIGFIMDGVKFSPEDNFLVSVYEDPVFTCKNSTPSGVVIIDSRYPVQEFMLAQTNITAGRTECRKLDSANDRELRCALHPDLIGEPVQLKIMVGSVFSQSCDIPGVGEGPVISIGPLYLSQEEVLYMLIFLAVLVLSVVTLMLICVACICKRQKVNYIKDKKRFFQMLEQHSKANTRLLHSQWEANEPDEVSGMQGEPPLNSWKRYIENILFRDSLADPTFTSPFTHPYELVTERYSPLPPIQQSSDSADLVRTVEYWMEQKNFLICVMTALESSANCTPQSRSQFVTLLMIAFLHNMSYVTEVMEEMVSTLVNDAYRFKGSPLLLFRRADRMAEKLVFNWLVFTMYGEVTKDSIARSLYELHNTVKSITEKGPVDAITGRSYYSLNLDNLLRKPLEYQDEKITIFYSWDQQATHRMEVAQHDSISQVKDKILDAVFRHEPYSTQIRPKAEEFTLAVRSAVTGNEEPKEEFTEARSGVRRVRKLLTVKDSLEQGCFVNLRRRQYFESPNLGGVVYNDYVMTNGSPVPPTNNGYSAIYTTETPEYFHLESPEDSAQYLSLREGGDEFLVRSSKTKKERKSHEKLQQQVLRDISKSSNLNRIVHTRDFTKASIEKLFKEILYYDQTTVPFPVAYLFNLFNQCAMENNTLEHVKLWKINCFINEFWARLIQKPDTVLDVRTLVPVEHSLETVAQALMDAASYEKSRPRAVGENSNPNVFQFHIPTCYNEITSKFFRQCDNDRIPINPYHRRTFLDDLKNIYVQNSERETPSFHRHNPQFMQNSPQTRFSNAQPPNIWESLYKVNALKLIYDKFLVPNAMDIIETTRMLASEGGVNIEEDVFHHFASHFSQEGGHSYASSRSY